MQKYTNNMILQENYWFLQNQYFVVFVAIMYFIEIQVLKSQHAWEDQNFDTSNQFALKAQRMIQGRCLIYLRIS